MSAVTAGLPSQCCVIPAGLWVLSASACVTAHELPIEGMARHVVCMSGVAVKQIWSNPIAVPVAWHRVHSPSKCVHMYDFWTEGQLGQPGWAFAAAGTAAFNFGTAVVLIKWRPPDEYYSRRCNRDKASIWYTVRP